MHKVNRYFGTPHRYFDPVEHEEEAEVKIEYARTVRIQYQTFLGVWYTMHTVPENDQYILRALQDLQWQKKGARVRAVDVDGRIVNIF
ncbi:MAG: hypothetical protein EB162_05555 [Euryarchaeota archaeon]|jgi:hypothetical protein|nr:hypothetical protein [Euryarchaeota archaeon]